MAKIPEIKRLVKEDFPKESQGIVDRIAFSYNPFVEQMVNAMNKQLNFDNLAQEVKDLTVITDLTAGSNFASPKQTISFNTVLSAKIKGIVCIGAQNLTDNEVPVLSTPFIHYTTQGSVITILHVTGLPPLVGDPTTSKTIKLTILLYS